MRGIIKENPAVEVNHRQIWLNIVSVLGLVAASMNVTDTDVSWADVTCNFV
jgi:hypothetical protein